MLNSLEMTIIVVDELRNWRRFATSVLRKAGMDVTSMTFTQFEDRLSNPNCLVIIGIDKLTENEMARIKRATDLGHTILVLATSLSTQDMRTLFHTGIYDSAPKPFDESTLINTVGESIQSLRPLST